LMELYRDKIREHFRRIRQVLMLPYETLEMAKRLYEICERDDRIRCWMRGKSSRTIAAGIMYIASILTSDDRLPITQREAALALNLSEPSVRNTYKKILEMLGCYNITLHFTYRDKRRQIKKILIHALRS